MTELMLAAEQTGRFHETRFADERTRFLTDEWREVTTLLPVAVSRNLGIRTPAEHLARLNAPLDAALDYDDARYYLGPVYARLQQEAGLGLAHARERSSQLFSEVFGRQVEQMRHTWQEGYFPRIGWVKLDGNVYEIYNHQPAFAFTGDVIIGQQFDWKAESYVPQLIPEFDMSPLRDESGDFVAYDPDIPVVVLPSMLFEPRVDRALAVAHLRALRDSTSPAILNLYARGLSELIAEEEAAASEPAPAPGWRARMAQLAFTQLF